ncbi:MAG TPA: trehalose-6-phosphate synthase [Steroidobacteraceae bacterium]|jgi:trehalose 6-phosphate synthase|nr:trehalose-6-phosphate synthase [Steroidobacteraceae bacterium]
MARLIVVSNRVAHPDQGAPPGGLAVGVLAALHGPDGGIWFGWSGKTQEAPGEPEIHEKDDIRFVTVDLPSASFDAYYNGFCNGSLWPLHHYFPGTFRYDPEEFSAYMAVNRYFADVLVKLIEDGDVIWVHDYQLIPLGSLLRQAGIRARIGFFLHIPYPNIAVLRLLPTYAELVRDMCRYDLVGFQTSEDLDGFKSAVNAVFPGAARFHEDRIELNGRKIGIGVFPIGVDVDAVTRQAADAVRTDEQVKQLERGLLGRKLLLGVDRLDYSKGLIERFASYQRLLESTPELQGQITYIQIAPLSRVDVAAYAELRDALERSAGHINGRFADTDWTPIRYLNKDFSHQTLGGFLRIANVGVVTPVRDGMNLVAKEFVAAQDPENPGALVLSSLAGAAQELVGALLVNPYDMAAVALALQQGLAMPLAERRSRHESMLKALRANSISRWHESFVSRLTGDS